ncbi:MAG: 50S ribosomal protein L13 [Candidatus Marinimicrobia bacterium]|nr:50S ribosomal protein L13 [Candidatus Neomarinimicrobiota bacterium]|tara:strand:+ start:2853 stop:3281 length:429 start_codon:yes stop_codon:yes gene_type:complete
MKTEYIKAKDINKKWYLIDADNQILGRFSSKIAQILRGKNKVNFTHHMDMGDFVVIVNADKIKLTGNKDENKTYFRHSGYPGGAKESSLKLIRNNKPEFILYNSIKGMLPHNKLGNKILKNLKIYSGESHPHKAQNPEKIEV